MGDGIKGKRNDGHGSSEQKADRVQAARMSANPPDVMDFVVTGAMSAFFSIKDVVDGALGATGGTAASTKGSAFNRHPLAHKVQLVADFAVSFKLKNGAEESDEIDTGIIGASFVWDVMEFDGVEFKTLAAGPTRIQVVLG